MPSRSPTRDGGLPLTMEFLLTALIVVLLPGSGVLYTLAVGLGQGGRAAAVAALGCTLGMLPQLLLATFGLSAIAKAGGPAFSALRLFGLVYLLVLAWQAWRADGLLSLGAARAGRSARQLVGGGIALNLLNPKLGLFFVAFLPPFVPAGTAGARATFFALGLAFAAMTLVVFTGYGLLAARVSALLLARPRALTWIRRIFAAAFALLALRLGFEALA